MLRTILIDELHLGVRAPKGLPEADYQVIRRTLIDPRFQAELRRAVRKVVSRRPTLDRARITVSR